MVCFFNNIKNTFIDIKLVYREYKIHFIVCYAVAFLALLLAMSRSTYLVEVYYNPNFYILMVRKVFNPVAFAIRIFLIIFLIYLSFYLMSIHFIFYLSGYLMIFLGVYFIMLPLFCSGIIDGFSGHLLALFCYLPLCFLTVCFFSLSMTKIYKLCNYSCDYKHLNNISYLSKSILKNIFYPFISNLISCFLFWFFIFLSLSLTIR